MEALKLKKFFSEIKRKIDIFIKTKNIFNPRLIYQCKENQFMGNLFTYTMVMDNTTSFKPQMLHLEV